MSREKYISELEFVIIYIAFGLVLVFQYSRAFTDEELYLFVELMLSYVWVTGLLVFAKIKEASGMIVGSLPRL